VLVPFSKRKKRYFKQLNEANFIECHQMLQIENQFFDNSMIWVFFIQYMKHIEVHLSNTESTQHHYECYLNLV
jgi:hypothetical protein